MVVNNAEEFWRKMGFFHKSEIVLSSHVVKNYGGGKITFMEHFEK